MKPILQGYVTMVLRKYFWCRLGKPGCKYTEYEAQIEIAKLSERERKLLRQGAYISLLKGGTWRFNRLKWTKKEIKAAMIRGAALFSKFNSLIKIF